MMEEEAEITMATPGSLQVTLEFSVELCKLVNVDLFQRGFYKIRVGLKTQNKISVTVECAIRKYSQREVTLSHVCVRDGKAFSHMFRILHKNEELSLGDVVLFKVFLIVDSNKIKEQIEQSVFTLTTDLMFSEESFDCNNNGICVCSRSSLIQFTCDKGQHYHLPIVFDYCHLSSLSITVHAILIAIQKPPMRKSIFDFVHSCGLGVRRRSRSVPLLPVPMKYASIPGKSLMAKSPERIRHPYVNVCELLLDSFHALNVKGLEYYHLLPQWQREKINEEEHQPISRSDIILTLTNTFTRLKNSEMDDLKMLTKMVNCLNEKISDLWRQFLNCFSHNRTVQKSLEEHHEILREKRFGEGFFVRIIPREFIIDYENQHYENYAAMSEVIRSSDYWASLPKLPVHCWETDGDVISLPIIIEDRYENIQTSEKGTPTNGSKYVSSNEECDYGAAQRYPPLVKQESTSTITSSAYPRYLKSLDHLTAGNMAPSFEEHSVAACASYEELITQPGRNTEFSGDNNVCRIAINFEKKSMKIDSTSDEDDNIFDSSGKSISLQRQAHASPVDLAKISKRERAWNFRRRIQGAAWRSDKKIALFRPSRSLIKSTNAKDKGSSSSDISSWPSTPEKQTHASTSPLRSASMPKLIVYDRNWNADKIKRRYLDKRHTMTLPRTRSFNYVLENFQLYRKSWIHPSEMCSLPDFWEMEEKCDAGTSHNCDRNKVNVPSNNSDMSGYVTDSSSNISISPVTSLDKKKVFLQKKYKKSARKPPNSGKSVKKSCSQLWHADRRDIKNEANFLEDCGGNKEDSIQIFEKDRQSEMSILPPEEFRDASTLPPLTIRNLQSSPLRFPSSLEPLPLCVLHREPLLHNIQQHRLVATPTQGLFRFAKKNQGTHSSPHKQTGIQTSENGGHDHEGEDEADVNNLLTSRVNQREEGKTEIFLKLREEFRKSYPEFGLLYSDTPWLSESLPYFQLSKNYLTFKPEKLHLIVCVHGLDGNAGDLRLVRTYIEMSLPGYNVEFLMSERNQGDTFSNFETMTDQLVDEILSHLETKLTNPARLSFIGHSLGNIVIRSAISRPEMRHLLPILYTFVSLSGPHLGTLYSTSGIVNTGLWLVQKLKKSKTLLQLGMKDTDDMRESFLYKLSEKCQMSFFKHILLFGSLQDRYVPIHSARIDVCKACIKDMSVTGQAYREMLTNILYPIMRKKETLFMRYDVHHVLPHSANSLIGRAAHIAVLDSEQFLEKFLIASGLRYFR